MDNQWMAAVSAVITGMGTTIGVLWKRVVKLEQDKTDKENVDRLYRIEKDKSDKEEQKEINEVLTKAINALSEKNKSHD